MKKSICWLTLLLLLMPVIASAQPTWFNRDRESNVSVTWLKANFNDAESMSFLTSVVYVTGHAEILDNFFVSADVPITYSDYNNDFFTDRDFAFGNPYLGIEFGAPDRMSAIEMGVRLPLALDNNDAVWTGYLTDWEHQEAFAPDIFTFEMMGDLRYDIGAGLSARVMVGPMFLFDKVGKGYLFEDGEFDSYLNYGLQSWYDTEKLRLGVGVTGRALMSENDLNFNERTIHELGLSVAGKLRYGIQPGLHMRMPIDKDLSDVLDYLVGLDVTVPFNLR